MPQNLRTTSKIRLVLQHTVANRAVFYCVHREAAGAKSAIFAIKNRVRARTPQFQRPDFIDIEPPAKVPYINGLAEHSRL
jgi:ethanolamine ammonia-lyase small subunit